MTDIATLGLRVDGTANIDSATSSLDRFSKSGRDAETAAGSLSKGSQTSSKSLAEVAKQSDRASSSMTKLSNVARRAGGVIAAALSTRALVNYADSWTNMTSRVELSIGAHEDASAVMGQLADISRQTYATMESTTEAFARNSFTLRALGKSTQDQINFTAALNNALAVSGAEGERALMVQNSLSRAMAEGTLRGEDLNNVLNSGSRVAELLADSLGVNVTQLRAVAADGRITSAVIYDSLVGAMEELSAESMGMGSTVRGSMRLMSNATLEAVGQLNQMYDVSGSVARRIVQLSDAIRGIDWSTHAGWISATAGATGALAAAYGTAAVASGVLTAATRLLNTVMRANPLVLAASAAVALGGALYGARNAMLTFGDTTASVMDWMRGAWLATGEVVGNVMGQALEASEGYWQSFVDYLGWAWDWMGTTFVALMTTIGNAVKQGVNWQIGLFLSVGDTVEILANAMIDAFKGAFQNILNIGKGFWESLTQIIQGNLDFEPFNAALRGAFVEPMKAALSEIGDAVSENMSTDHIGNAIEIVSDSITKFGEATSDYAFQSSMMRVEVDGAVESLETLGIEASDAIPPVVDLDDALAGAAAAAEDSGQAISDLSGELNALRNRLQPARAAQIQMAQSMNTLTLAYASGRIRLQEYLDLVWALQEAHIETADTAEDVADRIGYSFTTWEEVATSTISRVDNAGQDLWLGFIDSSRNALDTVKRFFQQTLAEIAHMLTTQRLTVAVAGSLGLGGSGSAMGGVGGGGMDFTSLGQAAYKGYNWLIGGGTAAAGQAGTAAVGYGGTGWASQVGTGTYGSWAGNASAAASTSVGAAGGLPSWAGGAGQVGGLASGVYTAGAGFAGGWLGNQVFGGGGESNTGAAVGTAVGAYVGSIVPVIGTYLGAAIGSFLGSGLGSLFGGEKTPFSGRFGTREAGAGGFEHLGNEEREGQFYRDSALGRVGFFDSGTERLQRAGTGSKDWADELSAAAAQVDNLVASLAQSEDELNAMRETVQGMVVSSRNANDIIQFALVDRPQAALEHIGGRFGDFVRSLEGGIDEVAITALIARDALALLESSQDRLNLTFESAADGAYSASFAIAEFAGGLDNLSALQSSYYQAYFSEAERAQHAVEDISAAFDELGLALPATHEQFRALVEAQDLHSEAGQRNYVQLLSLSGAYDQLNQSLERQIEAAYQSALGREADADGLAYWMRLVTSGAATLEDALWGIANSAESAASASAASAQMWADAGRTVSSSLAGIRETVLLDQLGSDEARYDYFREQAEGLARMIPQLDSAEAITDVTRQISGLTSQAYRILDSDQRSEMGDEFLRYLSRTEELSLQQLDDLSRQNRENADRQAEKNGKAVADAVAKEVGRIADAIIRNLEDSKKSNQDIADAVKRAVSQTGPAARYPEVDNRGREVNA